MSSIDEKLNILENLAQNQAVEKQDTCNEEILEINDNSQGNGNFEPKMTQEQANAVMNVAKDTRAFVNVKLSQKANDLIENDETVAEQFTNLAKDTVQQTMNTVATENKKIDKKNFFELNEKDVISMGGDKSSTHGQQFCIVMIKRFFWILFMTVLGAWYIAPMAVIIELFQGISFKNIEKKEITNGQDKKVEWVVKRHRLGIAGTVVGWLVGLAYWFFISRLIYFFPMVFLWISVALFITLLLVNILFGIDFRKIKAYFKRVEKTEENSIESGNVEIEVED